MAAGCECSAGLSNTGKPGCVSIFSVTSSMIQVPLFGNDGIKNGINLNAALPVWEDLINEADPSKRWFPLPTFENVELPKADSQFEEANSGRMVFLRQGKRSFSGELWAEDSTTTFLGKLRNSRCVDFGIYIIDVNGNLIGSEVDGYLYPIPVDNPSWDPRFMFATDSTTQKIMLGFDFDRLFDESTMYQISPEEAGINFNSLKGLIDVNFLSLAGTVTGLSFSAKLSYGTALNKVIFGGALAADFAITNVTTGLPIAIDSLSEAPEGTYSIVYSSPDQPVISDVVKIEISKIGYDGEAELITA